MHKVVSAVLAVSAVAALLFGCSPVVEALVEARK